MEILSTLTSPTQLASKHMLPTLSALSAEIIVLRKVAAGLTLKAKLLAAVQEKGFDAAYQIYNCTKVWEAAKENKKDIEPTLGLMALILLAFKLKDVEQK